MLEPDTFRQFHDTVGDQVPDPPTLVIGKLLDVWKKVCSDLRWRELLGKAHTTVDTLHANSVLLILIESREDVEQLSLADLWDELDHFVEDNGSLLTHLWRLIHRDCVIHAHDLLLAGR